MDVRTRHTLSMIRKSFIALIEEKPFHAITLKEVCDRAGIHRSTFYKYFEDIYDWRDRIERESLQYIRQELDADIQHSELKPIIVKVLTDMRDDANMVKIMLSDHWENDVIAQIMEIYLKESGALTKFTTTISDDTLDYHFFVQGSIGAIRSWQEEGMTRPIEEVADCIIEKMELLSRKHPTTSEHTR